MHGTIKATEDLTFITPETGKERHVNPHVHISATHLLASVAAVVAVMGTLHLLALTTDNRASRAWVALGF